MKKLDMCYMIPCIMVKKMKYRGLFPEGLFFCLVQQRVMIVSYDAKHFASFLCATAYRLKNRFIYIHQAP